MPRKGHHNSCSVLRLSDHCSKHSYSISWADQATEAYLLQHKQVSGLLNTSLAPAPMSDPQISAALIEATSQVSRFHLETLETTTKRDLQLQQVNLSVNNKQLLLDAVLQLQGGVRYGIVGRCALLACILLEQHSRL